MKNNKERNSNQKVEAHGNDGLESINREEINAFNEDKCSKLQHIICKGILEMYFLMMAVIYPFYIPGGYVRIGEVKYLFFRNASLIMTGATVVIIILTALAHRHTGWIVEYYRKMSVTDWFAYGYCLTVMLSYLCSDYKENALWGTEGWYMGTMSQIMFVLVYFFFSRYFCRLRPAVERWFYVWLAAAAGVFILGICNRYSLYPINIEGQTETFISTLGNINWFCGYWSVTAPMGIMIYWCSDRRMVRVLSGIFCFIVMLCGVTQGSNSAYVVFLAMLLFLFALSVQDNRKLYRFLELGMIFGIACQTGRFMQLIPGLWYNYHGFQTGEGSGITGLLITGNAAAILFLIILGSYVLFRVLEKKGHFHIGQHKWLRSTMVAVIMAVTCVVAFWLLTDEGFISFWEVPGTAEQDGYLEAVWDEDWGNGRGATWKCGIDAYRSMDVLHRFVGIGPDCFADYIYDVPELAGRMIDRFGTMRLTNAHNEWLTVLVNTGALGLFCYAGMFLTAFVRCLRRGEEEPLFYVCAAALLAYTVHNMVSFQQVLSTPYVFLMLGTGEGLRRALYHKQWSGCR